MRTTVIPAQITTVEDKIAGNLNLTQILILMVPIFWTAIVYVLFPPVMHLDWYKIPVIFSSVFICLLLSLRIKGKIVLSWLSILLAYKLRPKYYVLNKNEEYLRTLDLPVIEKPANNFSEKKAVAKNEKQLNNYVNVGDFVRLENILGNPNYTVSYKSGRKGGINVAFEKIGE